MDINTTGGPRKGRHRLKARQRKSLKVKIYISQYASFPKASPNHHYHHQRSMIHRIGLPVESSRLSTSVKKFACTKGNLYPLESAKLLGSTPWIKAREGSESGLRMTKMNCYLHDHVHKFNLIGQDPLIHRKKNRRGTGLDDTSVKTGFAWVIELEPRVLWVRHVMGKIFSSFFCWKSYTHCYEATPFMTPSGPNSRSSYILKTNEGQRGTARGCVVIQGGTLSPIMDDRIASSFD